MDNPKADEIRQWLVKSKRDLKAAQILMASAEPLLDAGVYHCQQSAEKALKGYLVFRDCELQRSHDLVAILEMCAAYDSSFSQLKTEARMLTPYVMEFRYPGDELEPDRKDAEEAMKMAATVLAFVSQKLPDEMTEPQ
ncbi:MAG: hypothetical protein HLUCCA11_17950 [Phormidesmis priestleyi Ana]|uniref:HEPN domain-containing protein n=1 Tax=Phormidesmis priestleyi Ana TaxID=1666911 RepID=A0A0P7ZL63_9CYAN|nr:MAG: hypothetical protein HLUCCA11_17950 [Phormidesmis priestleyi Ana]